MKPATDTPAPAGALQAVQNVQAAVARQSNPYGKFEKGKGKSMMSSYTPVTSTQTPQIQGARPPMSNLNHPQMNQHPQRLL